MTNDRPPRPRTGATASPAAVRIVIAGIASSGLIACRPSANMSASTQIATATTIATAAATWDRVLVSWTISGRGEDVCLSALGEVRRQSSVVKGCHPT